METLAQAKPLVSDPKRKVLIIEDEKDIRELVGYNLREEGFLVVEAGDGETGLTFAKKERPVSPLRMRRR